MFYSRFEMWLGLGLLVANPANARSDDETPSVAFSATSDCELHVFPTTNYRGHGGTGLGPGVIDSIVYGGKVASAVEQLNLLLKPSDQISALKEADVLGTLGLPAGTAIIGEPALISLDAPGLNADQAAAAKARYEAAKGHFRLTSSKAQCYSELLVYVVMYNATPIGNRVFATFSYRKFGENPKADVVSEGMMVGSPAKAFPAKQEDEKGVAGADAKAAFADDFKRWAARKVKH